MIHDPEITAIGSLLKPHGINGEITALMPGDLDPGELKCVIMDMDGIFVPFFIEQWRPKATETVLLKIEGIDDESHARTFAGKTLYALRSDIADSDAEDQDGFYTSDIIGFEITDADGHDVGRVEDYDDQTENVLLLVSLNGGGQCYLPLAEDLILEFDAENKTIKMEVPEGLTDL